MTKDQKQIIVANFRPPFKTTGAGLVLDADGESVVQIRGWGHLEKKVGSNEAVKIQDELEKVIANFFNKELNDQ